MLFERGKRYAALVVGRPVMIGEATLEELFELHKQVDAFGRQAGVELGLAVAMGFDGDALEGERGALGVVVAGAEGDAGRQLAELDVDTVLASVPEGLDALMDTLGRVDIGGEELPLEGALLRASAGSLAYPQRVADGQEDESAEAELEELEALGDLVKADPADFGSYPPALDPDMLADLVPATLRGRAA